MDLVTLARDVVWTVETGRDLARTSFGVGLSAGQNSDELIAAPAADEIAGAYLAAETGGELLQDFIAAQMPVLIVDRFKSINVEQQYAKFLLGCDAGRELAIQLSAVGDAGERIERGQQLDLVQAELDFDHLL